MTTITATPDPATGSIALEIDQTSVITELVRTDASGVSAVRVSDGQLPTPASGTTFVTDYEARHGSNIYTAYCTDISYRQNWCTNPSFEVDTAGWSVAGGTLSLYTSGSMAKHGAKAVQLLSNGTASAPYVYDSVAVTEGQWLGLDAWQASEITPANMQVRVQISFRDSGNVSLASYSSAYVRDPFYTGGRHRVVAQAPAGTVNAVCYLQFRNGDDTVNPVASGLRMWADAVLTIIGTSSADVNAQLDLGYFDGSFTDGPDDDYVWLGTANNSASVHTHTTRSVSTTADLALDTPWLMVPVTPNYSEPVDTITDYSAGRQTSSTVHNIIGRADPLVVFGKLGTRAGALEIWADSPADAERIVRVFDRGEAVLWKQLVPALDMYLVSEAVAVSPYAAAGEDTKYRVQVTYREVVQPLGNLAGALGWTLDGLAAAFPSLNAVRTAYADLDALTLDERL